MKKKQLYFVEGIEDRLFTFQEIREEYGPAVMIRKSKKIIGGEFMWCCEYGEHVLREDSYCGRDCPKYSPCNGKNGRCKYLKHCYEPVGDPFLLEKI